MAAFMIVTITEKNAEKLQQYAAKAGPTFAPFGGELLSRGKIARELAGASDHQSAAVVRFPDMTSLTAWHDSPAYQALVPLREEAATMTLLAYAEPPSAVAS